MKAAKLTEHPSFRLMRQTDVQNVWHMQMPRWLFSDPRYADMSLDAKVAYTFLLNRFQLSRRNGWVNDAGEVFVIFPRKALAKELRICEQRVTAAFRKLAELQLIWEKRCGRGDANQIYLKHERLMYYIAGKYSEVSVQREDIVQTAVLSLLKNEATLQRLPPYAQINYIAAAVRNTAINTIKRDQKETARCIPLDDLTEDFPQTHIPGAEVRYLEKERQEELLTAFQEIREEERQLLYGKYLMDLSDTELAQMLGCKSSSVRMKLTRARRAFVEKLREGGKNHE